MLVIIWVQSLSSIAYCQENQYWVRPNISVDCPRGAVSEQCVLLSDIANNSSKFFTSNTAVHFLGGVHTITFGVDCWISIRPLSILKRVENVSITGHNSLNGESAVILCQTIKTGFAIYNVYNLSLSGLIIRNCGFNVSKTKQVDDLKTSPNIYASLYIAYPVDLNIQDTIIEQSIGIGLLAVDLGGTITIENSVFQYNTNKAPQGMEGQLSGGNAYLLRGFVPFIINITNSLFAHGFISSLAPLFKCCEHCSSAICNMNQSAGLNIYTSGLSTAYIFIYNTTFYNNSAPMGANMLITSSSTSIFSTLIPTQFTADNCTFSEGNATQFGGGGIYLSTITLISRNKMHFIIANSTFVDNMAKSEGGAIAIRSSSAAITTTVQISNNVFTGNEAKVGAGIYIESHSQRRVVNIQYIGVQRTVIARNLFNSNRASRFGGAIAAAILTDPNAAYKNFYYLSNSVFIDNSANMGSAIHLSFFQKLKAAGNTFTKQISNCNFTQNLASGSGGNGIGSVINLENIEDLSLMDVSINDNNCRGIQANMSSIVIGPNVRITANSATQGAGIFLICYTLAKNSPMSRLILTNSSSLYIQNNNALSFGGGILVQTGCSVPELCFFKVPTDFNESIAQVHMSGNDAGRAGTSIYGGNFENCYLESTRTLLSPQLFWSIFNISTANTQPSVVASQAYKVCICTQNFNTSHSCVFGYNVRVYPGEAFHIPVVGVGQYNYSSPSVIRAMIANKYAAQIGDQQVTQEVNLHCKNLTYTLQTQGLKIQITLQLSIEVPFASYSTLPDLQSAIVNATILDCPFGFELHENSSTCDCIDYLARNGITCNIMDQTVHRTTFMWIGNYFNDIVVHHNCPFDYCNQRVSDFSLYTQEEQCSFNRTGVLCGACQPGYSLVLGTSLCSTECSNIYLLLLLPILIAGLVLVALLLKCNLTVSTGTINGLIFYANIIQVNNKAFFPNTNIYTTSYILSVFIAWINLDLGIEVCFAHDLDTYSRTWLQFLFPIYIWLLVGLLILVCRYSVTVTRLSGHYTVSVLATLFLLSYAKLLRTTLGILSPTTITDPQGKQHLAWLLDGNYEFLQWPHLAIFLAALVTLVVHLLPFTLLVLLGPTIQAHSDYKLLRWVIKFKPFLDAYQGPYKTKYRYWTGVMLLIRILLFVVFAGNAVGDPSINLLTILLTVLVLSFVWIKVGRVYRKSPLNLLELFYLLNLGVTTGVTLYLRSTSGDNLQSQAILTGIMVGSTLIVFKSTIIYHCYSEMIQSRIWKRLKEKVQTVRSSKLREQSQTDQEAEQSTNCVQIQANSPTRTVVSLTEALLTED